MKPNDKRPDRQHTSAYPNRRADLIPTLAIMHGQTHGGCRQCPPLVQRACAVLSHPDTGLPWILCEHPDHSQLKSWRRRGLSIIDLSAAIKDLSGLVDLSGLNIQFPIPTPYSTPNNVLRALTNNHPERRPEPVDGPVEG